MVEDLNVRTTNIFNNVGMLSGGNQQKVVLAKWLQRNAEVIIFDEPTTALDATTSSQIVELLMQIKRRRGMSMLFISHDFGLVSDLADDICVWYPFNSSLARFFFENKWQDFFILTKKWDFV